MPTIACYCEKCGQSFYSKEELYLPGLKYRTSLSMRKKDLKSWDDWVIHISTHCYDCREKQIPESCMEDYKRLKFH